MSLERFMNQAISSWMSAEGPDSDIVLSTRIRLARNMKKYKFPTLFSNDEAKSVINKIKERIRTFIPPKPRSTRVSPNG